MGITKIRFDLHKIVQTHYTEFFQRHLNDPDIVIFWNGQTQQFVLAYWIDKSKGLVDEIDDLGPNFEEVTREFVQSLERSRNYYGKDDLRKKYLLQAKRAAQKLEEDIYQDQERWDWMRKRTKDKMIVPYMLDVGNPV